MLKKTWLHIIGKRCGGIRFKQRRMIQKCKNVFDDYDYDMSECIIIRIITWDYL